MLVVSTDSYYDAQIHEYQVWLLLVKCSELLSPVSATSLGLLGRPTVQYQIFFLKDRVFRRRITTIQELKQAIVDEVAAIDEDLRRCVYGNFQTRLRQCIDVNRGHLPDVIFSK